MLSLISHQGSLVTLENHVHAGYSFMPAIRSQRLSSDSGDGRLFRVITTIPCLVFLAQRFRRQRQDHGVVANPGHHALNPETLKCAQASAEATDWPAARGSQAHSSTTLSRQRQAPCDARPGQRWSAKRVVARRECSPGRSAIRWELVATRREPTTQPECWCSRLHIQRSEAPRR